MNIQFCTGSGQSDTHIYSCQPYQTKTLDDLLEMVREPASVDKDKAQWAILSNYHQFDARNHKAQKEYGSFVLLPVDLDEGAPQLDDVKRAVTEALGDVWHAIYSSRSATREKPKWRILFQPSCSVPGADYTAIQRALFDLLGQRGLVCDKALERPGQLVYLPNKGGHYEWDIHKGPTLSTDTGPLGERVSYNARMLEDYRKAGQEAAERPPRRPLGKDTDDDPMQWCNANFTLTDLLRDYGYEQEGNSDNWRSPHQTSGSYATKVYPDNRWVSLSGSDFNAGIGEKSAESGSCFGDAYDLYVHYQHKGDHKKAYQALRAMMPENDPFADFDFHQTPQIETYDNDKGVTVVSEQEFINSLDIPDPIIDGVISRGRSYSLTAKTGHAKTALAAYFMMAVSEPRCVPWELVSSPCDVLFCSGENPDDLKMRVLGHYNEKPDLKGSRRHYVEGVFDIEQNYSVIKRAAEKIDDLGLIIIDTKQAFQGIDDDNSNTENLEFASICRRLTFLPSRPAVLVLCHPIKNATKDNLIPRGGSSYLNEVDGNLCQWLEQGVVTLHWAGKLRGTNFDPIKFKLKTTSHPKLLDKYGRSIDTVVLDRLSEMEGRQIYKENVSRQDKVLLSVARYPDQSVSDRCFDCGLVNEKGDAQKSTMHRLLDDLVHDKLIKKLRKSRYELTPYGQKEVERLKNP